MQDKVNKVLWAASVRFRGSIDPLEYKNYILVFVFFKYLSDMWKDHYNKLKELYGDNEKLIQRRLKQEQFILPRDCNFEYIYKHRTDSDIGKKIDKVFAEIEEKNIEKLEGIFTNTSFNSDKLGEIKDRNRRLFNLINDFANPVLDFRPSLWESKQNFVAQAYIYLLEKFASGAGRKGGEFFTPKELSRLLAKLLAPKEYCSILDPTVGSGSLLIKVAQETKDKDGKLSGNYVVYGQESCRDSWVLSKINFFLHGMDSAQIELCDTIKNPKFVEGNSLMKFDIVVANPPFSLDKWGYEKAEADKYKRFTRGIPPKSKGDYAFILHMIESTLPTGKVGVIVPHGVLFRGSKELIIRKKLLEENLLEAVIGLPPNLFYGRSIPTCILIFNKAKTSKDILFIDASKGFERGKKQNTLRETDIDKIVSTYNNFETIEKYSSVIPFNKVAKENDFNLNIPRYIDTFEAEEKVDFIQIQQEIENLEKELAEVQKEMNQCLNELKIKYEIKWI